MTHQRGFQIDISDPGYLPGHEHQPPPPPLIATMLWRQRGLFHLNGSGCVRPVHSDCDWNCSRGFEQFINSHNNRSLIRLWVCVCVCVCVCGWVWVCVCVMTQWVHFNVPCRTGRLCQPILFYSFQTQSSKVTGEVLLNSCLETKFFIKKNMLYSLKLSI